MVHKTIEVSDRRKAEATRKAQAALDHYMKALEGGARGRSARAKIAQIDATLAAGVKPRNVPLFENGRRKGSRKKNLPLTASDRGRLLHRRQVEENRLPVVPEIVRAEYLAALPLLAQVWSETVLLEVGVTPADLEEAGRLEKVGPQRKVA